MAQTVDVKYPLPRFRKLQVFAFDPSMNLDIETAVINKLELEVLWENLSAGPIGEYLEVVDIDPPSNMFYPPVDLDDPCLLVQDGLPPSEGNPQFHQQMVYAVAMKTIQNFEFALGRPEDVAALCFSGFRRRQFYHRAVLCDRRRRDRRGLGQPTLGISTTHDRAFSLASRSGSPPPGLCVAVHPTCLSSAFFS